MAKGSSSVTAAVPTVVLPSLEPEKPKKRRAHLAPETLPQGTYCEKYLAPRKNFVAESLSFKRKGKNWQLMGCPRGEWRPRRKWVDKNGVEHIGKCSRAEQAYILLMPKRANRKCPIGTKRHVRG